MNGVKFRFVSRVGSAGLKFALPGDWATVHGDHGARRGSAASVGSVGEVGVGIDLQAGALGGFESQLPVCGGG